MAEELAILRAATGLLSDIVSKASDGIAACANAVGRAPINKVKRLELRNDLEKLKVRLERIMKDYSKDPDRYQMDGDIEVEQLTKEIDTTEIKLFPDGQGGTFVYDLFRTEINEARFAMIEERVNELNKRAAAIENVMQIRKVRALPVGYPSPKPINGLPGLMAHASDAALTVNWSDDLIQLPYVAQYQLELRNMSEMCKHEYFRFNVKIVNGKFFLFQEGGDIVCQSDTAEFSLSLADVKCWTSYAVRMRKRYENLRICNWSQLSDIAKCEVTKYPPKPNVADVPFKAPKREMFTITVRRPDNFNRLKIETCVIRACPENGPPYSTTVPVQFGQESSSQVLECTKFRMTHETCKFTLYYVDSQKQPSQKYLELTKQIGSLSPSCIQDFTVENDQTVVKLQWTPPSDNNAGAIQKYTVSIATRSQFRKKLKKLADIVVTSDNATITCTDESINVSSDSINAAVPEKMSLKIDNLPRDKTLYFCVHSENFSQPTAVRSPVSKYESLKL